MKRTEVGKGVNNRIMLWPHSSFLSFVRHNVRPNKNTHYGRIKSIIKSEEFMGKTDRWDGFQGLEIISIIPREPGEPDREARV